MSEYLSRIERISQAGYSIDISAALSDGWALVKDNLGIHLAFAIITILISSGGGILPTGLLTGVITGGWFLAMRKQDEGGTVKFEDLFAGFQNGDLFLKLFLTSLITTILTAIATLFFIIPGIYLGIAYSLAIPVVVFGTDDFWPSMEACRKLLTKQWFTILGFLVVCTLVNLAGILALGVGVLVTFPLTMAAQYFVFKQVVGFDTADIPQVEDNLIV